MPRFGQMTDPEILAHSFKLSDAQVMDADLRGNLLLFAGPAE